MRRLLIVGLAMMFIGGGYVTAEEECYFHEMTMLEWTTMQRDVPSHGATFHMELWPLLSEFEKRFVITMVEATFIATESYIVYESGDPSLFVGVHALGKIRNTTRISSIPFEKMIAVMDYLAESGDVIEAPMVTMILTFASNRDLLDGTYEVVQIRKRRN